MLESRKEIEEITALNTSFLRGNMVINELWGMSCLDFGAFSFDQVRYFIIEKRENGYFSKEEKETRLEFLLAFSNPVGSFEAFAVWLAFISSC